MGHLTSCTRMGGEGISEVMWSFLNPEDVIFHCNFGIEWQGPSSARETGTTPQNKKVWWQLQLSSQNVAKRLAATADMLGRLVDFPFCVRCRDICSSFPSSRRKQENKSKSMQRTQCSIPCCKIKNKDLAYLWITLTLAGATLCNLQSVFPVKSYCLIQTYYHFCYTF